MTLKKFKRDVIDSIPQGFGAFIGFGIAAFVLAVPFIAGPIAKIKQSITG